MDDVKLRVYHRTQKDIVLLWSSEQLSDDQKQNVQILCNGKPMTFIADAADNPKDSGAVPKDGIPKDTIIAVIDHESNGLKPEAKYDIQVILGGVAGKPISRKIMVLEYGILPQFEKDRKSARAHLMGWDYSSNCWVKIPLVRTKNGYAVPTIRLQDDED